MRGLDVLELLDQQPLGDIGPLGGLDEECIGIRECSATARAGRAASVDDLEKEEVSETVSASGL